ncbi:MAG: hypothetical protein M0Z32_09060 [Actinomycetota bacterium]|nr:hypothetical protein [Actinomycetota bacterium]
MTRGIVLKVLDHRNKGSISSFEYRLNRYVIFHIPSQAVYLMDNHNLNIFLFPDTTKHFLKLRTVGTSRRLPAIQILINELPALFLDVFYAGVTLSRDRITLFAVRFLGLFLR